MLADLATLAPSLIVAAGFLIGVVMLLRREMAPRRRGRAGAGPAADMPAYRSISDQEDAEPTASSGDEETADRPSGTRSLG
jgi:hypothetical protein